jgi:hypothetical protein
MRTTTRALLLALAFALLLAAIGLRAQSPTTTTLEGTTVCTAVTYWFPDVFSRAARKGSPATQPILTLFSNDATQTVVITSFLASGTPTARTVPVPLGRGTQIDLSAGDANFPIEVNFSGKGAADLKMWTNGVAVESHGLPLCR